MLQKSVELDANNMFAYYELGRTYHAMELENEALGAYQAVLSISPQSLRELKLQEEIEHRINKRTGSIRGLRSRWQRSWPRLGLA